MKILGIIPARGGSKGIPLKNIKTLAGKPLINYTIQSAQKSKINKIVVSTDNKKIKKISESAGADVPFLRPKKISGDKVSTIDVVKHTLHFLSTNQSYVPDIVIILQPTSPLRSAKMINNSINLLKKSKSTSVITVSKIKTHPYAAFWYNNKYLTPFRKDFVKYSRRQKFPILYYPTGSIYTLWRETLKKYNSLYGPKIKPMIVKDEIELDIDTPYDLFMSEMTILHWKKYFQKFR